MLDLFSLSQHVIVLCVLLFLVIKLIWFNWTSSKYCGIVSALQSWDSVRGYAWGVNRKDLAPTRHFIWAHFMKENTSKGMSWAFEVFTLITEASFSNGSRVLQLVFSHLLSRTNDTIQHVTISCSLVGFESCELNITITFHKHEVVIHLNLIMFLMLGERKRVKNKYWFQVLTKIDFNEI